MMTAAIHRGAACLGLAAQAIVMPRQEHGQRVVFVDRPWPRAAAPGADGLVTNRAAIGLGVVTADCAPLLFADRKARVIAAAHAGWRGALGGILEKSLEALAQAGAAPAQIAVAIGPLIAPPCYAVGDDFRAVFRTQDPESEDFFSPPGHFDLRGYIIHRLRRLGVTHISSVAQDTYGNARDFFSARRAYHEGHQDYGRQLSLITRP